MSDEVWNGLREILLTEPSGEAGTLIGEALSYLARAIDQIESGRAERIPDVVSGRSAGVVDVLGKLLDRLPHSLSVGEVVLVLDRLDVVLRGHQSAPSVVASGPESPNAAEPIVGAASGVTSFGAPDAPSGEVAS